MNDELGKGGPVMSVYVGIDVHRKRTQVAVIDAGGEVLAKLRSTAMPARVAAIRADLVPLRPGHPWCGQNRV